MLKVGDYPDNAFQKRFTGFHNIFAKHGIDYHNFYTDLVQ